MQLDNWWTVKNLLKQENSVRKIEDYTLLEKPGCGDFGSYKKINDGFALNDTELWTHNDLSPKLKIKYISERLKLDVNIVKDVLDVGCGAGFTTDELGKFFPRSLAVGVDVSKDAISFAKRSFKNNKFICKGVEKNEPKLGTFDLIFCFEFYPFTRSSDLKTHKDFIKYFSKQLKFQGKIIICQAWDENFGLPLNLTEIQNALDDMSCEILYVPNTKILSVFKINFLSIILDKIARKVLKKPSQKALVISSR